MILFHCFSLTILGENSHSYLKRGFTLIEMFLAANRPARYNTAREIDIRNSHMKNCDSFLRPHFLCCQIGDPIQLPPLNFRLWSRSYNPINDSSLSVEQKKLLMDIIWRHVSDTFSLNQQERQVQGEEALINDGQLSTVHYLDNDGMYYGEMKLKRRHGAGFYTDNESSYDGYWIDGYREGLGKLCSADGDLYIGEFQNNKYHTTRSDTAFITATITDSINYTYNNRSSVAICRYAFGSRYIGAYKEGAYSGRGKYIYSNGNIYDGYWSRGKRKTVDIIDTIKKCIITEMKSNTILYKGSWSNHWRVAYQGNVRCKLLDIDNKVTYYYSIPYEFSHDDPV